MNSFDLQKQAEIARRIERGYAKANSTQAIPANAAEAAKSVLSQENDPLAKREREAVLFQRFFGKKMPALLNFNE